MAAQMRWPPETTGESGQMRRIGVEIEFAGIDCPHAAALVGSLFGGTLHEESRYAYIVTGTRWGDFEVELDTQYAHAKSSESAATGVDDTFSATWERVTESVGEGLSAAFAEVASLWLPVEIVSPPIPLDGLPDVDRLIPALRAAGAEGTDDGLIYAFATQFNPEVPSLHADSLLRHLRAFLLLAGSLRRRIDPDLLRRALPFSNPFPDAYVRKIVDPRYRPDLGRLIDDYVDANPTRNRELDMLPVFAHLDPDRVRRAIADVRIKSRPTFHYRLPDTRLSDPEWSLVREWNRWVEVEFLAADEEALEALGRAFLGGRDEVGSGSWPAAVEKWRIATAGR